MFNLKKDEIAAVSVNKEVFRGKVVVENDALLILADVGVFTGNKTDEGDPFQKLSFTDRITFNKASISWVAVVK